ncbi:hypothetical protein JOC86_002352 [Bacillus pakistanensis]|uniref:YqaI-like protein n=1 Tax=Rossellomorea pakistanensis TaxID=992288 RepID=A0ABS2ND92_9BACI|nr:hypothetical protein [Bacillus pakistanensis]MBM7585810.1 hypothetical protein [Bacillus pakistanensis]
MLELPAITLVNRTGYETMTIQPEHCGIDYFGDEILAGDDVIEDDGELILKDNLERYLAEKYEFKFKTA